MTDRELIQSLGGPTKVAQLLGTTPQRVHNWLSRGIPPKVKLENPHLFLLAHSVKSKVEAA